MNNLFHRLANRASGKAPAIKPQTSAAFFADAPKLKQDEWLENSFEQSVIPTVDRHNITPYSQNGATQETSTHINSFSTQHTFDRSFFYSRNADNKTAKAHGLTADEFKNLTGSSSFQPLIPLIESGKRIDGRDEVNDSSGQLNAHTSLGNNHQAQNRSSRFNDVFESESLTDLSERGNHVNTSLQHSEADMTDSAESSWSNFHVQTQQNQFRPLFKSEKNFNHQNNVLAAAINAQQNGKENNDVLEVHVSIGRIEIKAPHQQPTEVPKTKKRTEAPMSLEAYLAKREGGKR